MKRTTRAVPQSKIDRPSSSAITSISGDDVVDDAVDDVDDVDVVATVGCDGKGLVIEGDNAAAAVTRFAGNTGDRALVGDVAPPPPPLLLISDC